MKEKLDLSGVVDCRDKIFSAALRDSDQRLKSFATNLTRKIHAGEISSVNQIFDNVPIDLSEDLISITSFLV